MDQKMNSASISELKASRKSLARVKATIGMSRASLTGPRFQRASLWSAVSAASLFGLTKVADKLEQGYQVPSWSLVSTNQLIALVAVAVFLHFITRKNTPRTWREQLELDLAKHNPIDRDAYQALQQTTANLGYLDYDEVLKWINAEQGAIVTIYRELNPRQSAFLRREV